MSMKKKKVNNEDKHKIINNLIETWDENQHSHGEWKMMLDGVSMVGIDWIIVRGSPNRNILQVQ